MPGHFQCGMPHFCLNIFLVDLQFIHPATLIKTDFMRRIIGDLLSFAAGAMVYVVVEELIPEMSEGEHSNIGTVSFALGFILMMALDVGLG